MKKHSSRVRCVCLGAILQISPEPPATFKGQGALGLVWDPGTGRCRVRRGGPDLTLGTPAREKEETPTQLSRALGSRSGCPPATPGPGAHPGGGRPAHPGAGGVRAGPSPRREGAGEGYYPEAEGSNYITNKPGLKL